MFGTVQTLQVLPETSRLTPAHVSMVTLGNVIWRKHKNGPVAVTTGPWLPCAREVVRKELRLGEEMGLRGLGRQRGTGKEEGGRTGTVPAPSRGG